MGQHFGSSPYRSDHSHEPTFEQQKPEPSVASHSMTGPGGFQNAPAVHGNQIDQNRFYGDGIAVSAAPHAPIDPTPVYAAQPAQRYAGDLHQTAYSQQQFGYAPPQVGFEATSAAPPPANAGGSNRWPGVAAIGLLLISCAMGGLYAYNEFGSFGAGEQTVDIPTIYPPQSPERSLPTDTGGLVIPDRDKVLLNDRTLNSGGEFLRPAPETPRELDVVPIALQNQRQQTARPTQLQDPFADLLQPGAATTAPALRQPSVAPTQVPAPAAAPAAAAANPSSPDIGSFLREIEGDRSSAAPLLDRTDVQPRAVVLASRSTSTRSVGKPNLATPISLTSTAPPAPLPAFMLPLADAAELATSDFEAADDFRPALIEAAEFAQLSVDAFEQPIWTLDRQTFQAETDFQTTASKAPSETFDLPSFSRELAFAPQGATKSELLEEQIDNTVAQAPDSSPLGSAALKFTFQSMGFGWDDAVSSTRSPNRRFAQELASLITGPTTGTNSGPAPFSSVDFDPFNPLATIASRESNLVPGVSPPVFEAPETGDGSQFAQLSLGGTAPVGGSASLPQLVEDVENDINRFNQLSAQDPLMLQPGAAPRAQQPEIDRAALAKAQQQAASDAPPLDSPFGDAPISHRPEAPTLPAAMIVAPFGIQLGSVRTRNDAETLWNRLQTKHVEVLGDMLLDIEEVMVKGKLYHRIQAGPVPNRATAADVCAVLKMNKQDCIVVKR